MEFSTYFHQFDVAVEDNEKAAKYKDNKFYKCTVLKTSGKLTE